MTTTVQALTVQQYKNAFLAIEEKTAVSQRQMLRIHYEAPERTVTPTQLAEEVGFKGYGAANLHYGRLARGLCEFLGLRANALELGKGGRRLFLSVLATFEHPEREWEWTMRPSVAKALEQIGWCGRGRA